MLVFESTDIYVNSLLLKGVIFVMGCLQRTKRCQDILFGVYRGILKLKTTYPEKPELDIGLTAQFYKVAETQKN